MTKTEISETQETVKGLCKLARELGYRDPCFQLQNSDGTVAGDLLYFLADNPSACGAIIDWCVNYLGLKAEASCFVDPLC